MTNGYNRAIGLRPHSSKLGGSWNEQLNVYYLFASADGRVTENVSIFEGDPVQLNAVRKGDANERSYRSLVERYTIGTTADNHETTGREPRVNGSNTQPVAGVFSQVQYYDVSGELQTNNRWIAGTQVAPGTEIMAYIYDDPMTVFDMQVSTSTNFIRDAIFAGDYTGDEERKPTTSAYFSENFMFGLGGGEFSTQAAMNNRYPNTPNNPATGDVATGLSRVYLDVGVQNRGAFDDDNAVNSILNARMPLKVIGFTDTPENSIVENRFVRPFLNVRVMINHHVAKAGTNGTTPPAPGV